MENCFRERCLYLQGRNISFILKDNGCEHNMNGLQYALKEIGNPSYLIANLIAYLLFNA